MRQSWQKSSLINGLQHDEHSSTTDVAYSFEISLSPEVGVPVANGPKPTLRQRFD